MICLDHNATTPVLPEVVEAMMPFFREEWGNPSSSYRFGSRVKKVIEAISLMWANNETGVLSPVEEIAALCRTRGILFHCDAVQAADKIPIDLKNVPIDYLSLTGHKIGAPKGVGALFVRRKAPFTPFIQGGHQERGRRGGTESVPLVAGLGLAAEIARKKTAAFDGKVGPLRDALEQGILTTIPQTELNGHPALRLANTTNITFHGIESEALLYNFTLQPPPLVAAWRNGKLNVHSSVDYESIRNR